MHSNSFFFLPVMCFDRRGGKAAGIGTATTQHYSCPLLAGNTKGRVRRSYRERLPPGTSLTQMRMTLLRHLLESDQPLRGLREKCIREKMATRWGLPKSRERRMAAKRKAQRSVRTEMDILTLHIPCIQLEAMRGRIRIPCPPCLLAEV